MSPRVRLIGAAVLFCGWLAWLGYAAAAKNRGPVVSRAQATAVVGETEKGAGVIAHVEAGPDGAAEPKVVVKELVTTNGPKEGTELEVANLSAAAGFSGSGDYLLLLVFDRPTGAWVVAGRQRSPGYDLGSDTRPIDPVIYPATDEVKAQATKLLK
jgi:hypothetical protein